MKTQKHDVHRPRGTVGYSTHTPEERRAYNREWERRKRGAKWRDHGDKRECKGCRVLLLRTPDNFGRHPAGRLGFNARCKTCMKAYNWKHKRTGQGLTRAEYAAYMQAHPLCTLCHSPQHLRLDHCHATGIIRGVLCNSCNTGLGMFRDHQGLLLRAAAYIKHFQERS